MATDKKLLNWNDEAGQWLALDEHGRILADGRVFSSGNPDFIKATLVGEELDILIRRLKRGADFFPDYGKTQRFSHHRERSRRRV